MPTNPRKSLLLKQSLGLQTRFANDIQNEFDPTVPPSRDHRICARWRAEFPTAIPRTNAPTYGYNCHGLTFAARWTQVWSSEEVSLVLKEDGYQEVAQKDATPGDIILYYSTETGEIEHSGIVVAAAQTRGSVGTTGRE